MCLTSRHYVPDSQELFTENDSVTDLVDDCDYIDVSETVNTIEDSSLACIQWNVRGLVGKQLEISKFLHECGGSKKIDIVILSETWLNKNSLSRINIPGYKFVGNNRVSKKGGGVGFLLNESLNFKLRKDLHVSCPILENITIDVKIGCKYYTVCSMYRSPNSNATEFVEQFKDYLTNRLQTDKHKELIVGLDHNLDLLRREKHAPTQDFLESILDLDMVPMITKPTRITRTSATLIDNILMSRALSTIGQSCIIENDISDHLPSLVILPNVYNKKSEPIEITCRDIKPPNIKILNDRISNEISIPHTLNNVNEKFNCVHNQLMDLVEEVCPEKVITIPAKRVIREPWVSKSLLKCSTKQRLLYKNFLKDKTKCNETKYKNYRNVLKKVKRKCKRDYYYSKCTEFRQNTKKLWQVINQIAGKCNDKTTIINCLKIDNIRVYNSQQICNNIGKYFSTVGESYASKINNSKQNIDEYVSNITRTKNSLFLKPCTKIELLNLINGLPSKTSSGFDNLSNKLLKAISISIVPLLVEIFNESIEHGVFPDRMKHAEVIPLFKSGEHTNVINYRPISLLITISKILEKVMYNRTYDFLVSNKCLYDSQYGFRKKHSCEHAITELVGNVVKAWEKKTIHSCYLS